MGFIDQDFDKEWRTHGVYLKPFHFIINKITNIEQLIFEQYKLRPSIKYIKNNLFHNLVGAEIGTFKGQNALTILKYLPIQKLYLIEPDDKCDKLLMPYRHKIEKIIDYSYRAVNNFNDDFFDFVYIDGDHRYREVFSDLENYYLKVKSGGVLCGHDFNSTYKGVVRAVLEFASIKDIELFKEGYDWWIIK